MKIWIIYSITFIVSFFNGVIAQNRVYKEVKTAIEKNNKNDIQFTLFLNPTFSNSKVFNSSIENALEFDLSDKTYLQLILDNSPFVELALPFFNNKSLELQLIPIEIFGSSYQVFNSKNQAIPILKGKYYKGIIKGDSLSIASISLSNGEVSGFVSSKFGHFQFGKKKDSGKYILYSSKALTINTDFSCQTNSENSKPIKQKDIKSLEADFSIDCSSIQVYFEADSSLFAANGYSVSNTVSFVNTLFSQVAILYSNEGISVKISELKVWDTTDPYFEVYPNTGPILGAFKTQIGNSYNGDIAHLLTSRISGGRADQLDGLFYKGAAISAGITNSIENIPVYSYNVEVITHEIGHHMGSPHTHSCTWPGGPLDNCMYPEGNCAYGPPIINGGTIMSYCNVFYNINFANGFGPKPGNLIRNHVLSFLTGGSSIDIPLTLKNLSSSEILITWPSLYNTEYIFSYKKSNSTDWTSINTWDNTLTLNNLIANTLYDCRINLVAALGKAGCGNLNDTTFFTGQIPKIDYCFPSFEFDCGIWEVYFNNNLYQNVFDCYIPNFSFDKHRTLNIGQNTFSIRAFGEPNTSMAIYIDYNKDGIFTNTERIYYGNSNRLDPGHEIFTGSFNIPTTIVPQKETRLRIVLLVYNFELLPITPCSTYTHGDWKDYLIDINGDCLNQVNLTNPINNITAGKQIIQSSLSNGFLSASNIISGNYTTATYQSKSIELNPGFTVDLGSIFKAEVAGCN